METSILTHTKFGYLSNRLLCLTEVDNNGFLLTCKKVRWFIMIQRTYPHHINTFNLSCATATSSSHL